MDEVISTLTDILSELQDLNFKLDRLLGTGLYDIQDIYGKLDNLSDAVDAITERLYD